MTLGLPDAELHRLRHDFRAPLTIVTGFAEVLAAERPISEVDRRDYAARIQAAADEIGAMLDSLLDEAPV